MTLYLVGGKQFVISRKLSRKKTGLFVWGQTMEVGSERFSMAVCLIRLVARFVFCSVDVDVFNDSWFLLVVNFEREGLLEAL